MGPTRKSRSVNKRYSYVSEVSPTKDGDSAIKKTTPKKRKLSDMLGPQWSKDELERFYEAYRKHGKDWKKVAAVVRNRSVEMVEAVYTMNRAYLSLPEGTASVAGFYAMMTDYYANMKDRDSEQESNDGAGTSRKPQKRHQVKVQAGTSKGSDGRFFSQSQAAPSSYGCLSLLKKKRTGGSRPRAVGKRTPRFPVGYSYENINGEKFISPTRKGLKVRADDDDEVAHEIALALAGASQRGGSPQVSHTPNRRTDSAVSSPVRSAERTYGELEMTSKRYVATDTYEDDLEGSMEADNVDCTRGKGYLKTNVGGLFHKGKGSYGKKLQVDRSGNNHLDDIREACSGTEEGQKMGAERRKFDAQVDDAKTSRHSSQGPKKRSKKVLFRRDEISALDALQTLADLSLMMPAETNEDESSVLVKGENYDRVGESELPKAMPASRQREKRKSSAVTGKGNQPIPSLEIMQTKTSKTGKTPALDDTLIPEAIQESYQSITKGSRKRQKISARKIPKGEAHSDTNLSEFQEVEARDSGKMPIPKSKRSSQSASPQLVKHAERSSSSNDPRKEGSDSTLSTVHASGMNQVNLPTGVRSRRKMQKPQILEDVKYSDESVKDKPGVPFRSLHERTHILKEKLSNCLSNHRVRRWCAFEWFYSAIDYPWFAKTEFVEYLHHVGLGHVPRLTRVEWGVIRSSLGKPRRFSDHFLKEEKEKLNQYRDSVRTHYAELRSGTREGLPTDLARPLSVGQRVIAIYPKTREIHDGSVLTVDHSRCRVQFDRPELGVAFIMDIDCMPLNPLENMPTSLASQNISVDKFFESFNELKSNGRAKDQRIEGHPKHPLGENVENADDPSRLSPSTYPLRDLLKQVAPVSANPQSKIGPKETATNLIPAKEADVKALAELTRALDKKEAVVFELRRMNDDVLENQKDGDSSLKDSETFKKQYAAVLVQLNEANAQVSDALYHLRGRNTYGGRSNQSSRPTGDVGDSGCAVSSSDRTASNTEESECHVNEIVESSRTKASTMVDMALQAMSSLKTSQTVNIDATVDYVRDRLPLDDSFMPPTKFATALDPVHGSLAPQEQLTSTWSPLQAPDGKLRNGSDSNKAPVPVDLITRCVATLFMIQKCTERQFPPADVARILDSAVTSLEPCCSENLPMYAEVQKYMSIVKNQILALVPT